MTHRFIPKRQRLAPDVSFARKVIAEAERIRRAAEEAETLEAATCEWCGKAACEGTCPEYYENLEAEQDEYNAEDDDE